jgi:hypothetical protein
MARDDEKIVTLGAVLAHFAEGYAKAIGADSRRFRQDFHQITLTEREAAKSRDGRLLTQQVLDLCSGIGHRCGSPACVVYCGNNIGCLAPTYVRERTKSAFADFVAHAFDPHELALPFGLRQARVLGGYRFPRKPCRESKKTDGNVPDTPDQERPDPKASGNRSDPSQR